MTVKTFFSKVFYTILAIVLFSFATLASVVLAKMTLESTDTLARIVLLTMIPTTWYFIISGAIINLERRFDNA